MNFNDLTDEQRAKAGTCNTTEELLTFVKEEGIELSEKDLERISGGSAWGAKTGGCPECGSDHFWISEDGREAWCENGHRGPASSFLNH